MAERKAKPAGETKRRTKLTLKDRIAKDDRVIASLTRKLEAAKARRQNIIDREAKRAQELLDSVNAARALEQVPMELPQQ